MTNPKNVDDVVNSLQLLIKLAGENLEHIEGFLALNYKYWVNRVIRHSSKTGTDVADSNQQGNEDGRSETITKHSQSKEDLSGVGGSDTELLSVPENERGDNGIKNGETDEDQKGAGTSKSVEMEGENSRKRKLPEETSDSSDMELVRGAEIEGDSQKSVAGDKKRKKLEDGLEMEVDVSVDTDVKSTVNDIQSECAVKMSSEPEIDMELEDILEGKTIKDASTDVTEDGGDAETEKANDMNESFLDISSQNEEVIVPEKHAECSSSHETADETSQSETNYTGSGDTVHEIDEKSEKSFESLSTVHVQRHEQDLPTREVSGIVNDPEKTAMCVEDTLQENQPKKLDEEQDCAKINVESEAKREDSEDAPVDEVSNNKENEVVSENDSNGNDASMDFLFENECDKSQGDEVEGNVNNDEIESVESLAAYLKATMKRPPEESNKTEVSDGLGKDTIAEVHCALMEGSEEDREDFEVQNHKTGSDKSDVEENKMDTSEEPGKCTKEIDEKKKLECDYEEVETSGIRKLEVNDDMSECEGKENVAGKIKAEVNEDTTEDKDNVEEKTVDSLNYTEDCIKAQQALLEYSTDDEDSCAEEPLKKIKERLKKAKENEVAVCKDTKPAKKQRSGPKSRTRKGKESTSAASASSVSDVDSSCSVRRQDIKADGGRGKKFRLKDTEAYKQGGKLGWKCTVLVERLLDEVFQKYYEQYYSDGENECEKKAKDDKEIDSLVNLKSLKKVRTKKCDMDESDTEDSDTKGKRRAKKKIGKSKTKEEQKLIDFFNQMDDDDDSLSSDAPDSEKEVMKAMRLKKNFLEKENEMAMKMLLGSSTDDGDSSEKEDDPEEKEKSNKKANKETEDVLKEEEKKKEVRGKKADSSSTDDDFLYDSQKKRGWRNDKLLTERLSDLNTSDEERRWEMKKEREQKEDNNDSEENIRCKKKSRKKRIGQQMSDSDNSNIMSISNRSSSSDDFVVMKRKKPSKKTDSKDSTSDSDVPSSKVIRRRRIRAPAKDSSSSDGCQVESSQKSDTPGKGRKNIHRILKDDNVGEATRRAGREEEERKKRILEKQKLYNEIYKQLEGTEKLDKLVLDFDPETKEELVAVDPFIVSKLKPHQVKGVKFMWDACFESLKEADKATGSGCILAHCMGLGKTLQVVALVHTLLKHENTNVKTVLVVSPLNTVLNWVNEFNMWLKDVGSGEEVNIFELSRYKQNYERMYQVKEWQDCGGVMVIGYDMFRILTNPQAKRMRKNAMETFQSSLVDPGPDLVVCDEGHLLKNEDTALAKAMRRIRTLRRIVLTGTPLQNNLKEYHCMVQFVKPNLLGNRKEFQNRFMNPISNGQFEDSTAHDVKIMKRRAHVLHKMLEGSIQRFDYSVLTPFLPPKQEYVISIRLSEVQIKAYRYYLEHLSKGGERGKGAQLFTDFQNLSRIWTHPRVLQMSDDKAEKTAERKRLMESDSEGSLKDFIDDDDETTESSDGSSSDKTDTQAAEEGKASNQKRVGRYTRSTCNNLVEELESGKDGKDEDEEKSNHVAWWKQFIDGDELDDIKYSGKLTLLFSILRECEKIGDKVLVFSQSLYSLDLIEYFLARVDSATQDGETKESLDGNTGSWSVGLDYFRLDGSTSSENRNVWCKLFNREENHRARLFIISTRAGGLGINLYAANRVIIFDASWNPSHDVQSIFRVYRFGQKKPCYIYRFLAQGTMEEKIYDRQVTKLSLSCRVVDEQQIERHYNMADLQELYQFDPEQKTKRPTPILPKDRLLAELLKEHEHWIVTYHEHDSLLQNKEEEELNEEERKVAWEEYENEKKGKTIPPVITGVPGLNIPALRETLRNENPLITEDELQQKVSAAIGRIFEYLNTSQNTVPAQNYQMYYSQLQALQQYRIQQEQLKQAEQQETLRQHQENIMQTGANYSNPNVTFRQFLQDRQQTNQNITAYPTNLYRNIATDNPGILRMHSKLVPSVPPSSSLGAMLPNLGGKQTGRNEATSRPPMLLQLLRPSTSVMQPPFASNTKVSHLKEFLEHQNAQQPAGSSTTITDDMIETID
ncbi:transcriptional regulator ATRX-like isoform X1 [Zootermopsis nevadensis]|nr:transcriptional regulator ATRX-like isoform X1 [Zootermopsis nevadensis]XP_021926691.1 transcriptional regulator ATRX-like isoform X1 [Zootermopsis nevadensis]